MFTFESQSNNFDRLVVQELPYCVHLKFLYCNYLCKDNKI